MPSYRYTREIKEEDLKPQEEKQLSPKEKRKNWWHYYKRLVALGLVIALLVGYGVYEVVSRDKADITIGIITEYTINDAITEQLKANIAEYVDDVNGDGKVVVHIETYTLTMTSDEDYAEGNEEEELNFDTMEFDYQTQMASVTRLSGALSGNDVMLFLVQTEYVPEYQDGYGLFCYLADGSTPADNAKDYENMTVEWDELPVLAAMDLNTLLFDELEYDAQNLFSQFSLGVRIIEGTSRETKQAAITNWEQAMSLLRTWGYEG